MWQAVSMAAQEEKGLKKATTWTRDAGAKQGVPASGSGRGRGSAGDGGTEREEAVRGGLWAGGTFCCCDCPTNVTRAHETTKSGPRNDVTNHYAHSSVTWLPLKCADLKSILLARYKTFVNTNHFVFLLVGFEMAQIEPIRIGPNTTLVAQILYAHLPFPGEREWRWRPPPLALLLTIGTLSLVPEAPA